MVCPRNASFSTHFSPSDQPRVLGNSNTIQGSSDRRELENGLGRCVVLEDNIWHEDPVTSVPGLLIPLAICNAERHECLLVGGKCDLLPAQANRVQSLNGQRIVERRLDVEVQRVEKR